MPYPGALLHRGFGVRQHIEAAEVIEGVRLHTLLTATSFNAIGQFVAAGLGHALSSRMALPQQFDPSAFVNLPMKNPLLNQGRSHIVSRHGRSLPPAAAELLGQVIGGMSGTMRR